MQLIRLVKVHYSVPQLARQDLLKCRRLMVHSLKVQMAVRSKASATFDFPAESSFFSATAASRAVVQAGLLPSNLRAVDEREAVVVAQAVEGLLQLAGGAGLYRIGPHARSRALRADRPRGTARAGAAAALVPPLAARGGVLSRRARRPPRRRRSGAEVCL